MLLAVQVLPPLAVTRLPEALLNATVFEYVGSATFIVSVVSIYWCAKRHVNEEEEKACHWLCVASLLGTVPQAAC